MLRPLRTRALRCDLCGGMLMGNTWPFLRLLETKSLPDRGLHG